MVHVPYKGTSGAVRDLVSGNIETMFLPVHVGLPLVQQNTIRALAVGSAKRSSLAPDIPTLAEQGIEGVDVDLWYALMAPAGTPAAIVDRYNKAINEILSAARRLRDRVLSRAAAPGNSCPL